jgi:hypothetical protein
VAPNFASTAPRELKRLQGDVSISFSCDPEAAHRLIDIALAETLRLQVRCCCAGASFSACMPTLAAWI